MKVHKSLKPQKCTKCNDETWFSENGIKEHFVLMHHQAENTTENSGGGKNASKHGRISTVFLLGCMYLTVKQSKGITYYSK